MQLTDTSQYAVDSLLYLAWRKERANCTEISQATGIPKNYLQKMMITLKNAGMIQAFQGESGGYALAHPASEITLFQIFSIFERTTRISSCLEPESSASKRGFPALREFLTGLQNILDCYTKHTTLADLLYQAYEFDYSLVDCPMTSGVSGGEAGS